MTAATFTGTGRGKAGPEEQFRDAPGEDTKEEFPLVLEDAEQQPKEGKPGASKSKGKKLGDQPAQATEGAEAPPEKTHSQTQARLSPEIPPRPPPTTPPSLPPKTLMKMNPQLLLSMSWSTKQQAKLGYIL